MRFRKKKDLLKDPKMAALVPPPQSSSLHYVRRIRLVCDDPEATDSDSDDEYQTSINSTTTSRQKRIVVDIRIPDSPVLSGADVSSQDSSALPRKPCKIAQSKKLPSIKPLTTASLGNKNKMRGVRQRRWGKWAAEIRDPIRGRRLWLGTYDTAEEASIAYRNAALSIEAEKNALSLNNHRQKNKVICSSTSTSVSTSDDSEAQNRFSLSSPSSVLALAKPVNDAKMTTSAALTIPITTATRAVASSPAEDKVSAAATTQPGVLEQGEEDLFIPFDQEYLGIINMDLGSELDGLLMEDDLGQIVGDLAEMEDVSLSGFDDKLYGGFDNIDPSGWIDA